MLSTGSDPFGAFQRFALEMGYKDRIQAISLGQGQGPVAERLIEEGLPKGDWIFLQVRINAVILSFRNPPFHGLLVVI